MASGGNNFNYFPENQLTKFCACSLNCCFKIATITTRMEHNQCEHSNIYYFGLLLQGNNVNVNVNVYDVCC